MSIDKTAMEVELATLHLIWYVEAPIRLLIEHLVDDENIQLGEHDPSLPKLSQDDLRMDALFAIQAGACSECQFHISYAANTSSQHQALIPPLAFSPSYSTSF